MDNPIVNEIMEYEIKHVVRNLLMLIDIEDLEILLENLMEDWRANR